MPYLSGIDVFCLPELPLSAIPECLLPGLRANLRHFYPLSGITYPANPISSLSVDRRDSNTQFITQI